LVATNFDYCVPLHNTWNAFYEKRCCSKIRLKTGKFLDLNINVATRNERTDATETAENVCKDDLVIRDLGYFSAQV
jgi:hypothetical protein